MKLTPSQILGYLDAKIEQIEQELAGQAGEPYDRGRLQAYQDVVAYIQVESSMP